MWNMVLKIFTSPANSIILGLITLCIALSGLYSYEHIRFTTFRLKTSQEALQKESELRKLQQLNHENYRKAVDEAIQRQIDIRVDSSNTDTAITGLQQTIKTINANIKRYNKETTALYTTTYSKLLEECVGRYKDVAERADGHVSDIKTLIRILDSQ